MRNVMYGAWLPVFALAWSTFGAESSSKDEGLVVTLTLQEKKIAAGKPVALLLTVKNQGQSPIHLIRPRSSNITRIHEHGWIIEITGPQGVYGLFPAPRGVEPVVDTDIIELAPGEFVGAEVTVGHYVLLSRFERPQQEVGHTPGIYRARLTYHAEKGGPFLLKERKQESLFLGPVSSEAVEYEITKKEEQPNKPDAGDGQ